MGIRRALPALALLAAAGCGHQVDEDAWRADLERDGVLVADWSSYAEVWAEQCGADDDELELFVAVGLDSGSTRDEFRTNIRHACPDRLEDLEALFADLDLFDDICDRDPAELTDDEQLMAEASGC